MRRTLNTAFDSAVGKFEGFTPRERLRFRLRMAFNSDARAAVIEYIKEEAALDPSLAAANFDFQAIDIDEFEKWIQLILKYLPQIIALIEALFV